MLEDLEMPVKSEVAYLNVLLNLIFQSTSAWKNFQSTGTRNISKVLVITPSFKELLIK